METKKISEDETPFEKVMRLRRELEKCNADDWELVEASLELAGEEMDNEFKKAKKYDLLLAEYIAIKTEYICSSDFTSPEEDILALASYLDRLESKFIPGDVVEIGAHLKTVILERRANK